MGRGSYADPGLCESFSGSFRAIDPTSETSENRGWADAARGDLR